MVVDIAAGLDAAQQVISVAKGRSRREAYDWSRRTYVRHVRMQVTFANREVYGMSDVFWARAGAVVLASAAARSAPSPALAKLTAGAGRAAIALTPAMLPIDGFETILDPLQARFVVLADGPGKVAIAIVDQTSISADSVAEMKRVVAEATGGKPGQHLDRRQPLLLRTALLRQSLPSWWRKCSAGERRWSRLSRRDHRWGGACRSAGGTGDAT